MGRISRRGSGVSKGRVASMMEVSTVTTELRSRIDVEILVLR